MQLDPPHHPPGGLVLSILRMVLQLVLATNNPHDECELVHRDITGTYYLYCVQTATDGTEMISIGHFVPNTLPDALLPR